MARRLNTMQDIMAAFQRGEKDVIAGVKTGINRCLLVVAREARNNVKAKMGPRPTGAGSSLIQNIGTGEFGVKRVKAGTAAITGEVGTSLPHGIYLEFGTGIYGPKAQRIYPKKAKVLSWEVESGSEMIPGITATGKPTEHKQRTYNRVFFKSVKGVPAWKWLSLAMAKAAPQMQSVIVTAVQEKIK